MKNNTVDLYISQLLEDLANGYTWLKKDNVGYGSIQEKYEANEIQINAISKHPKLIGVEPSVKVFNIIDDLKTENSNISEISKPEENISTEEINSSPEQTTKEVEGAEQLLEL